MASLFRSALERGEAPTVLEDGHQRRDFVHVTDVALANALAVETQAPHGSLVPVNICSGDPHTVGELATELAKAYGGPAPKVVGGARPGDVRHVVADPRAARERLGFTAMTTFEAGVAEFATAPLRAPAAADDTVILPAGCGPRSGSRDRGCARRSGPGGPPPGPLAMARPSPPPTCSSADR